MKKKKRLVHFLISKSRCIIFFKTFTFLPHYGKMRFHGRKDFDIMKKLNIYFLAVSIALETTPSQIVRAQEVQFELQTEDTTDSEDLFDQALFNNSEITFSEIDRLLNDHSWQINSECSHPQNTIYQKDTNSISWEEVFIKVKENNEIYLKEYPKLDYLTTFSDEELKEILGNHEKFISILSQDYNIDLENIAYNLENLEILKDTRVPIIEVPYFANYEPSTQTMTFLEEWDLEYYKITQAHEDTHLAQSSHQEPSSTKIKQSVWEEPIEYSRIQKPSPLRTIALDEYIAYVESQKIDINYPIDIPEYHLLYLLELSFIPNTDYRFQDTLASLSLSQNQKGFYDLFGNRNQKENKIHRLMHSIDLCYGFFADEWENLNVKTEELIQTCLLEINRNLFQNLIESETVYSKETLFYLMKLNKQYSLFILDNYMLEENEIDKGNICFTYLNNYEKLETIALSELEKKYNIPELYNEYQEYNLTGTAEELGQNNQELINQMILTVQDFYNYNTEKKSLYLSQNN